MAVGKKNNEPNEVPVIPTSAQLLAAAEQNGSKSVSKETLKPKAPPPTIRGASGNAND